MTDDRRDAAAWVARELRAASAWVRRWHVELSTGSILGGLSWGLLRAVAPDAAATVLALVVGAIRADATHTLLLVALLGLVYPMARSEPAGAAADGGEPAEDHVVFLVQTLLSGVMGASLAVLINEQWTIPAFFFGMAAYMLLAE